MGNKDMSPRKWGKAFNPWLKGTRSRKRKNTVVTVKETVNVLICLVRRSLRVTTGSMGDGEPVVSWRVTLQGVAI